MSLKFGQIQPLVSMVTDRVMMGKNSVSTFYASNFEKVGNILLSACLCVCPSVRPLSVQKKIKARVLKFHIWILRQKKAYPYFFLV